MSDRSNSPRDVPFWPDTMPLPAPATQRELFLLLGLLPQGASLHSLLQRVDWQGMTPARIEQVVFGRPPHEAFTTAPPPEFDPPAAFAYALLSPEFRAGVLSAFLRAFPELGRDIFIHVPKCAGTDLTMYLGQRQLPLPSIIGSRDWIDDQRFVQLLSGLGRNIPFQKRLFVYGHITLGDYIRLAGLRPTDRIVSVLRDPLELMVSQANYVVGRMRQDPTGKDPDTAEWMQALGVAPGTIEALAEDELKNLVVSALLDPQITPPDRACGYLGQGLANQLSFEDAIGQIITHDVELTTTDRYEDWMQERWGGEGHHAPQRVGDDPDPARGQALLLR